MLWECLLLFAILGLLIYKWSTAPFSVFKDRGIPYEKPYPIFGNATGSWRKDFSMVRTFRDLYKRNKQHKIFGFFNMREPIFFIHDPEYIKKMCIKDFEFFPNRNPAFQSNNEPLLSNMLINMKDQKWRNMRNTLTPVFTAAKMRAMFSLMEESFDNALAHLESLSQNGKPFEFELKETFTRLSNDIIASTAFGLKINSYAEPDNQFYKIGQSITNFRGKTIWKIMFSNAAPWLSNLLGLKLFDEDKTDYFMRLVCDAMKYRKEHNIVRADMIQLLMEAQKESTTKWEDVDLVAQCFIFFFAAFENNANLVSVTCMELMYNPDIQQRLYEEVQKFHSEMKGEALNYDILARMKYLDMVVSEALRKNSFAPLTDRVCAKDYKLYDDDGNFVFEFKKGDILGLPIMGFGSDPEFFENPDTFDPERFSDENKHNIHPCTYIPFGVGPRNCIGNRYAQMQVKAMIFHLVLKYKMERAAKTPPSLLEGAQGFTAVPKNCWIRFVPRQ